MEQKVLKEYMNKKIIQKCVIFASAFGLNITDWKPATESSKYPYRIYFYCGQNNVGYIDATVKQVGENFSYVNDDFSFVIFTPIGNAIGNYSDWEQQLSYEIEVKEENYDCISGFFKIKNPEFSDDKNYSIKAEVTFKRENKNILKVDFNNWNTLSIHDYEDSDEELSYSIGNTSLRIRHSHMTGPDQKEILADITVCQSDLPHISLTNFKFSNSESFQKIIETKANSSSFYLPFWQQINAIDLSMVISEIEKNDPRMYEFINQVRNNMSFSSYHGKLISLYDRIANLCFSNGEDDYLLRLSQVQDKPNPIENNPVFQKLQNYKKTKK